MGGEVLPGSQDGSESKGSVKEGLGGEKPLTQALSGWIAVFSKMEGRSSLTFALRVLEQTSF